MKQRFFLSELILYSIFILSASFTSNVKGVSTLLRRSAPGDQHHYDL